MSRKLTLTHDSTGRSVQLPVLEGSIGLPTVGVGPPASQFGLFTHDSGFGITAPCRSAITLGLEDPKLELATKL